MSRPDPLITIAGRRHQRHVGLLARRNRKTSIIIDLTRTVGSASAVADGHLFPITRRNLKNDEIAAEVEDIVEGHVIVTSVGVHRPIGDLENTPQHGAVHGLIGGGVVAIECVTIIHPLHYRPLLIDHELIEENKSLVVIGVAPGGVGALGVGKIESG